MEVNSPLKIHGGKSYIAPKIVAVANKIPHIHFVEPYFGGGSVLLAKDYEGISEVVNDLDSELTAFWRVLQNVNLFAAFCRQVEAIPFSESEFNGASDTGFNDFAFEDPVACAVNFFIRCRQSLAGRKTDFATLSRNRTRRGMNEQASAWLTAVEGLPQVHERLKRVVILNRDALDVIRQQDGERTLYFLDPPYLHSTRSTTKEYGEFEMSAEQHTELLELLTEIKGKFLLSGYQSELYDKYYLENNWRRYEFDCPINSAGGKEKRRATECLWTNWRDDDR